MGPFDLVIDGLNLLYLTSPIDESAECKSSAWKRRRLDHSDPLVKVVTAACRTGQRVLMLTRHDKRTARAPMWGEMYSSFAAADGTRSASRLDRAEFSTAHYTHPKYLQCARPSPTAFIPAQSASA